MDLRTARRTQLLPCCEPVCVLLMCAEPDLRLLSKYRAPGSVPVYILAREGLAPGWEGGRDADGRVGRVLTTICNCYSKKLCLQNHL